VIMRARRAAYQNRIFRTHEVGVPVISVGNLTLGGTGKTPLVEWVAARLADRGHRVCILTRGYGRTQPEQRVVVSDGSKILADATLAGDEALLLAESLIDRAAVISDRDRVAAAQWAISNLNTGVFVLDDGFQHLRIARSLNLVTIDATNPWGNGRILPAGTLREPRSALRAADCVVVTRADDDTIAAGLRQEIEKLDKGVKVLNSRMRTKNIRPVSQQSAPFSFGVPVAAFCGVGNPTSFFAHLEKDGHRLCYTESFRDHHVFTFQEIGRLSRVAHEHGAGAILTTAKDEVKLRTFSWDLPCYAVDVAIEIDEAEMLHRLIELKD